MAINPDILYNFNDGSSTLIFDYSENDNHGSGTNLTISATDREVGYDAVFNGTSSKVNVIMPSIDNSLTIAMAIKLQAATGTDYIFDIDGGEVFCTWDGTTLTFSLDIGDGTFSLANAVSINEWHDIVLKLDDNTGTMYFYVDGVELNTLAVTGTFSLTNPNIEIGHSASANHGKFLLNEFKLFQNQDTTTIDNAFIAEQNGVLITSSKAHGFLLGDIIGYNPTLSDASYAIVTFVQSTTKYRIQPISDNLRNGMVFKRCGHLYTTNRQWMFLIDNTPQICFYDGISKTSEVGAASKKLYCLNKEGIIKNSITKTANYTVASTDQRIYVDSSGGAFTITLEASPKTNREIEIIDSTGGCITSTVTVDGNGNNIMGDTTFLINDEYIAIKLVYNGTLWNII